MVVEDSRASDFHNKIGSFCADKIHCDSFLFCDYRQLLRRAWSFLIPQIMQVVYRNTRGHLHPITWCLFRTQPRAKDFSARALDVCELTNT